MSARRKYPHPLSRFVPPLAIAFGSLSVPFAARCVRALGVVEASEAAWIGVEDEPKSEAVVPKENVSASEPIQRVEDLPLARPAPGRQLSSRELTRELVRKAREILSSQYLPLGAEIPLEVHGRVYIARVERHFHEVGGPKRPWGYHKGMTLYSTE